MVKKIAFITIITLTWITGLVNSLIFPGIASANYEDNWKVYQNKRYKFTVTYNSDDWSLMENNKNSHLIARMIPVRRWDTWDMVKGISFYNLHTFRNTADKERITLENKTIAYLKRIKPSLRTKWMGYEIYYYPLRTRGWLVGLGKYYLGPPPKINRYWYEYNDTYGWLSYEIKKILNSVNVHEVN